MSEQRSAAALLKQPPAVVQRLVYLGTPALAVPPLLDLHRNGFEIPLVVTNPDKRRGRGGSLSPSPVKAAALELGLDVSHDVDAALDVEADIGVVVAFGRIVKRHVLENVPMVNVHFSLLPRWRGAAPLERAILEGDSETGICLMALEETLDTGPVYRRLVEPIRPDDTLDTLRDRLVQLSGPMLVSALSEGLGTPSPQVGEVRYAEKIDPAELEIDWNDGADQIGRLVRVGGAWTTFRGKRLRIWAVSPTSEDALEPGEVSEQRVGTGTTDLMVVTVQPEARARMDADSWINGARIAGDERLG